MQLLLLFISFWTNHRPPTTVDEHRNSSEADLEPVVKEPFIEKDKDSRSEHPAVVVVFATAVIENSSTEMLSQSELKNLQDLVFRDNHLKAKNLKLEFGQYLTHGQRNHLYKHTLELKLHVSTKNLWEGARSYIWRHFGQNEWSKGNGARVVFTRIHVK